MSSSSVRPLPTHFGSALHFDDRTALHLMQAFANETDLERLLMLLFSQLQALGGAHGMLYAHTTLPEPSVLGRAERHHVEYNLDMAGTDLGKLTVFFPVRQHEQGLETTEDVLSLAFAALRNALALRNSGSSAPHDTAGPAEKAEKSDSLILIALDEYAEMRQSAGEEWAHILMSSVRDQIEQGLRQADGVYQITDDTVAVLLPNTSQPQAKEVAAKIRVLIAGLTLTSRDDGQPLTACMGIGDARFARTAEEVMEHARDALRRARNRGRNQIEAYEDLKLDA